MNDKGIHNLEGQEVVRKQIKWLKEVRNVPFSTFTDELVTINTLSMFLSGKRNLGLQRYLHLIDKLNEYLAG